MPRRTAAASSSVAVVLRPRQFCGACAVLLAVTLLIQACVLINLLHRLAEVHRAGFGVASGAPHGHHVVAPAGAVAGSSSIRASAATAAGAASASTGFMQSKSVGASGASSSSGSQLGNGLALGVAYGLGRDAVLLYLASLLRSSPGCRIVLFVDAPLPEGDLRAEGIDTQRVVFETVQLPLPSPWEQCHADSARYRLYQNYFLRTNVAKEYGYVLLSHVDDVVFQSDPFDWIAKEKSVGVHVFSDEPGRTISNDFAAKHLVQHAFGPEEATKVNLELELPAGYVIGTAAEMLSYVNEMCTLITTRPPSVCHAKNSDQVIHDVLCRRQLRGDTSAGAHGFKVIAHANRNGPVWNGGFVPAASVSLDNDNMVINEDGFKYVALHQYVEHDSLWKLLSARFLKGRSQRIQNMHADCSGFDISPGDMRGFDLSHTPADHETDCCAACLLDRACGAFIHSASRRHCWLKKQGGMMVSVRAGDDMRIGVRRS